MSITLAIDLFILVLLLGTAGFTIYANLKAYKDPTYCMFRPTALVYSVAAGLTGFTTTPKSYLLISFPILLIVLGVTYFFGLSFSFYYITVNQAACLAIVVVFRKLNLIKVCG
jgi:hypothetical protein